MPQQLFRKILVAHDGSEPATRAFEKALLLAALTTADLHVISIGEKVPKYPATAGEVEDYEEDMEGYFGKLHKQLREQADEHKIPLHTHLEYGHEVKAVTKFVDRNRFDLLVIGGVRRPGILKRLLGNWGSTAHNLARLSPCTVLVVR